MGERRGREGERAEGEEVGRKGEGNERRRGRREKCVSEGRGKQRKY